MMNITARRKLLKALFPFFAFVFITFSSVRAIVAEAGTPAKMGAASGGEKGISGIEMANDQQYLTYLLRYLRRAKESVDVVALTFHGHRPIIEMIQNVLVELAEKGVVIRVFLEGDLSFAVEGNKATQRYFKEKGIKVRLDSENKITHAKMFIIDQRYVLVGSTNLTDNSILNNNEANVLVDSPAVGAAYTKYFNGLWKDPSKDCNLNHHQEELGLRVVTDREYYYEVLRLIKGAKSSISITKYIFWYQPDQPELFVTALFNELLQACKRGVRVKLFLESEGASNFVGRVNRASGDIMEKAGVTVVYDESPHYMHSKIVIVDGRVVVVSSFNWSPNDIGSNHNAGIVIYDEEMAGKYLHYFEEISK